MCLALEKKVSRIITTQGKLLQLVYKIYNQQCWVTCHTLASPRITMCFLSDMGQDLFLASTEDGLLLHVYAPW